MDVAELIPPQMRGSIELLCKQFGGVVVEPWSLPDRSGLAKSLGGITASRFIKNTITGAEPRCSCDRMRCKFCHPESLRLFPCECRSVLCHICRKAAARDLAEYRTWRWSKWPDVRHTVLTVDLADSVVKRGYSMTQEEIFDYVTDRRLGREFMRFVVPGARWDTQLELQENENPHWHLVTDCQIDEAKAKAFWRDRVKV